MLIHDSIASPILFIYSVASNHLKRIIGTLAFIALNYNITTTLVRVFMIIGMMVCYQEAIQTLHHIHLRQVEEAPTNPLCSGGKQIQQRKSHSSSQQAQLPTALIVAQ
jgi:hypothetical protein